MTLRNVEPTETTTAVRHAATALLLNRLRDGVQIATDLAQGLKRRGYNVWRDEVRDSDDLPFIGPGSEAQVTIAEAIRRHGFVLLVDPEQAVHSAWIEEEIATAISGMLPILPIVVPDATGVFPPLRGGRFGVLQDLQREVRLSGELGDGFLNRLGAEMNELLLGHLRTRRRLLHDTRERFTSLRFSWSPVSEEQLLFTAVLSRHSETTPELYLRLLVQCAPYDRLLSETVDSLCKTFKRQVDTCQFCVLVHPTGASRQEKVHLLRQRGGHVMLLRLWHRLLGLLGGQCLSMGDYVGLTGGRRTARPPPEGVHVDYPLDPPNDWVACHRT